MLKALLDLVVVGIEEEPQGLALVAHSAVGEDFVAEIGGMDRAKGVYVLLRTTLLPCS